MNHFIKFYKWGTHMKFHMSIYCMALLFFYSIYQLFLGFTSVNIWVMLSMLITCFIFATFESFCFPLGKTLTGSQLQKRTLLWALIANVIFIGASRVFGWFAGIPTWGAVILIIILEGGLIAMWYGDQLLQRMDTRHLNQKLRHYQNKS